MGKGSAQAAGRVHYGFVVLGMSVLVVTGALGFARFGYTMILPGMKEGLGLSYTEMGLLATGNFIGYLLFALTGGFLAARFGPRLVISLSLALVGATMLLTGLANSFVSALALRTLTGVGSGGSNVPVMGLLSAWFAPQRRGLASGAAVGGSSLGLFITGPLVPAIVAAYGSEGWRYSWYFLGVAVVVLGLLSYVLLRNRPKEKGLAPLGTTSESGLSQSQMSAAVLLWGSVYRSRVLWRLGAIYFAFGFSYIIYATFFATYLIREGNWTQAAAGGLWAQIGLISVVSGLIWGAVSDRWGRRLGLSLVFALQGLSFLTFAVLPSVAGFYLSALLFALTAWSIPAIMAAACGDYLGPRLAPAALGFITLIFGIGQAIGPGVGGAIADLTGSFRLAFLVAAAAALAGALGSLTLRPPAEQPSTGGGTPA
jgi:MFS family permease